MSRRNRGVHVSGQVAQAQARQGGGGKLYAAAVAQARSAAFYRDFGVRDSLEGRFELFSLHVIF
jgi:hypothetical protein